MIIHCNGSLLDSRAQALVNPVNCRGVMGKGLALAFRQRWPQIMGPYRTACSHGDDKLEFGKVLVLDLEQAQPQYVLCVPTKDHWSEKSSLENVIAGLKALVRVAQDLDLDSIAVPALGCGEGGLQWDGVKPVTMMVLMGLRCRVELYEPRAT